MNGRSLAKLNWRRWLAQFFAVNVTRVDERPITRIKQTNKANEFVWKKFCRILALSSADWGARNSTSRRAQKKKWRSRNFSSKGIVFFWTTAARIVTIVAVITQIWLGTSVGTQWSRGARNVKRHWFGKMEDAARFREHEKLLHILWNCNCLWFEADVMKPTKATDFCDCRTCWRLCRSPKRL